MIEFLLVIILFLLLFCIYHLRKLPWYLAEYRDIQFMIFEENRKIALHYENMGRFSSHFDKKRESDRQKIFEINNKLTEIIKLNERLLNAYCATRPEGRLREILELLRSINSK